MSAASEAAAIVQRVVEAWNSHDVDRITSFFHDDFENWQAPLPTVRGLDGYRRHLNHWFGAYPDLHLDVVTLFAEENRVCLETSASGTPATSFFGETAGGGRCNRALDILELRDGKVWRQRGYWDFSLWTGQASPLADHPSHRERHAELTAPTSPPGSREREQLCYVEFFRRAPNASVDEFRRTACTAFAEWAQRYPEDELLANLGRTWRLGPYPYLLAWRCDSSQRWTQWDVLFGSGSVDDIESPILDVMITDAAGFYRELVPSTPALGGAAYYLETFRPWDGAADDYRRRAQEYGAPLTLLLERVGRLAPDPGGIAVLALDTLSDALHLQRDVPESVVDVGVYAPTGREIL